MKKQLATELPMTGMHKSALKINGGSMESLYDSPRFEDGKHSRNASHTAKKDSKSYRPYQRTGSFLKSLTE